MPLAPHPCRRIDAPRWLVRDRFDNAAKLRRVRAPVFLMHGDADTLVTPDNLDRLARARPDATVARVAGAGHELAYTAPAQAILIRWVRSEEPTSELQSNAHLVCRLLLEKKQHTTHHSTDNLNQDYEH